MPGPVTRGGRVNSRGGGGAPVVPRPALQCRALQQAGRELLLAQASDWPFILRTGTSPEYARQRINAHLLRFTKIYEQLLRGNVDDKWLEKIEARDNLFSNINPAYWD